MDSATTFGAAVELLLTANPSMGDQVPPWEWDARIIWAFQHGLANRGLTGQDVITFLETILPPTGQVEFTAGFVLGVGAGAKQAIHDYIKFVANTFHLFSEAAQEAKLVFDVKLLLESIAVYLTSPGSPERSATLERIAKDFEQRYPEIANAIRGIQAAGEVLDAIVDYLSTPNAAGDLAVAVSGLLGQAMGALFDGVRPYLSDALKLGRGVGYLIGQLVMWIIFDLIGLPFSVALDVLETVIQTGMPE